MDVFFGTEQGKTTLCTKIFGQNFEMISGDIIIYLRWVN